MRYERKYTVELPFGTARISCGDLKADVTRQVFFDVFNRTVHVLTPVHILTSHKKYSKERTAMLCLFCTIFATLLTTPQLGYVRGTPSAQDRPAAPEISRYCKNEYTVQ